MYGTDFEFEDNFGYSIIADRKTDKQTIPCLKSTYDRTRYYDLTSVVETTETKVEIPFLIATIQDTLGRAYADMQIISIIDSRKKNRLT